MAFFSGSRSGNTRALTFAAVLLGLMGGIAAGVGGFTFIYAKGASYMTDNPTACANCHIMRDHYDAWQKSSHHAVATCNDCHTPHNFVGKYVTKAQNGFHHSLAFTTQRFREPIQITARNRKITEAACRHCHREIVHQIDRPHAAGAAPSLSCTNCHHSVGHMQ